MDGARVLDLSAYQRRVAAGDDLHVARILDRSRGAIAFEHRLSSHEILGAHVQRRGDKAARIHVARRADEDTVGVDDEHAAIGIELSMNLAGGVAGHASRSHLSSGYSKVTFRKSNRKPLIWPSERTVN